jgi:hypothetical protein
MHHLTAHRNRNQRPENPKSEKKNRDNWKLTGFLALGNCKGVKARRKKGGNR